MSQQELLARVVTALDAAGIEYMVTGSIASSLQGEPRSTHDIDFVVAVQPSAAKLLVRSFPPPEFYLDEGAIQEAIDTEGMFNLIAVPEGDKADFWVLTGEPFDQARFGRRYVERVFGLDLKVSSPEDTILQKLRWSTQSDGVGKAFVDAVRVYEVQRSLLDIPYIESWVARLHLGEPWTRLLTEAEVT